MLLYTRMLWSKHVEFLNVHKQERQVPAIPGAFVAGEFELLIDAPWPQLVKASNHAAASRPSVQPQHHRRLTHPPTVMRRLVEHVEQARLTVRADGQVP